MHFVDLWCDGFMWNIYQVICDFSDVRVEESLRLGVGGRRFWDMEVFPASTLREMRWTQWKVDGGAQLTLCSIEQWTNDCICLDFSDHSIVLFTFLITLGSNDLGFCRVDSPVQQYYQGHWLQLWLRWLTLSSMLECGDILSLEIIMECWDLG